VALEILAYLAPARTVYRARGVLVWLANLLEHALRDGDG